MTFSFPLSVSLNQLTSIKLGAMVIGVLIAESMCDFSVISEVLRLTKDSHSHATHVRDLGTQALGPRRFELCIPCTLSCSTSCCLRLPLGVLLTKICRCFSQRQSRPVWNSTLCSVIFFYILHAKNSHIDSPSPDFPADFPQIEHCVVKSGNIISISFILLLCSETSFVFPHESILHLTLNTSMCVVIAVLTLVKAVGYCNFFLHVCFD
jgi:hypothetical protein